MSTFVANALMFAAKLPKTATSATRTLLISAWSISKWITFACLANSAILPVTRSSKRAPTAINKSHCCTAMFAALVPCIPSIPK